MSCSMHFRIDWRALIGALTLIGSSLLWLGTAEAQFDGFTEPYRTIELASDETGLIERMLVKEGDRLDAGQEIARLSSDLQRVQLELAEHMAGTSSAIISAEQGLAKREQIWEQIQKLRANGHAHENELVRAEMELDLARSRLQAARDEHTAREIELRRATAQLERRTIVAPFSGVVANLHRKEGEFLSPVRPEVVTLVDVDQLYAVFSIPSSAVNTLEVGKTYPLEIGGQVGVNAKLDSIGVQTDAESGTVRVKLLIDNHELKLRAGEPCVWNL
ncbi:MAG: efflux RND transporter periplasmic adaptor subunit [Planctomycetota bacterium]|jgi:RND family efflux transporter MFP subunit